MHVDAQVVEAERAKGLELVVAERRPVGRGAEAEPRQPPPERPADTQYGSGVGRAIRRPLDPKAHALRHPLPGGQLVREPELDRRAVRLERGVGPVPLVLVLPEVAGELEAHRAALLEVDLEAVEGGEEREIDAALEALWADQLRELAGDVAVRRSCAVRTAARFPVRVEDAEADPAVEHVSRAGAVVRQLDRPVRTPFDPAFPREVDVAAFVANREADLERVPAVVELIRERLAGDRVPVTVADRRVDPADDLDAAHADVAQIEAVNEGGEPARLHRAEFLRRCVDAVPNRVLRGRRLRQRHLSPPDCRESGPRRCAGRRRS